MLAGRTEIDDIDRFVTWLGDVGDSDGCAVQAFDARYVAGHEHLKVAVEHANRAWARGENVARDRGVEVLLYAAGRRQIDQAIEMGVSAGEHVPVVVVVDAGPDIEDAERAASSEAAAIVALEERVARDDALLESGGDDARMRAFFDVSEDELGVAATDLPGLVRERVALLDVEK